MNNAGVVSGAYVDENTASHGFVAYGFTNLDTLPEVGGALDDQGLINVESATTQAPNWTTQRPEPKSGRVIAKGQDARESRPAPPTPGGIFAIGPDNWR